MYNKQNTIDQYHYRIIMIMIIIYRFEWISAKISSSLIWLGGGGKFFKGSLKKRKRKSQYAPLRDNWRVKGEKGDKVKRGTYFLTSQTSSLLPPIRRVAHHSARFRIHATRLSSADSARKERQNLKSVQNDVHSAMCPYLYKLRICEDAAKMNNK